VQRRRGEALTLQAYYARCFCVPQVPMRVALVSCRKIRKGEELTWDYGVALPANGVGEAACYCGHRRCRGFVY
jgi:SET domain-containing protein